MSAFDEQDHSISKRRRDLSIVEANDIIGDLARPSNYVHVQVAKDQQSEVVRGLLLQRRVLAPAALRGRTARFGRDESLEVHLDRAVRPAGLGVDIHH